MEKALGTVTACRILGISRATLHRRRNPKPPIATERRPFHHPAQLSEPERRAVLEALTSPRFVDKSPGQVWATLLDEGVYLCSQATMYRLLREAGQTGERRAQARHRRRRNPNSKPTDPTKSGPGT
jgi:putative transposase